MSAAVPQESALLDAALSYARRGWPVFPAHTAVDGGCSCRAKECDRVGKHPRTRHGLEDATTDEAQIRRWWATWRDANVCIRTGEGLFVLDIDPKHDGDTNLVELERAHGALPLTVESVTGSGGRHIFFGTDVPIGNSVSLVARGIDVRCTRGYVVAAPSLHASGRRYAWEVSHHPDETPLAALPEWLARASSRHRIGSAPSPESADHFIEGGRNRALASLAGTMRRRGMSGDAIEAALLLENTKKCRPPLDEAEVRRVARSVARYAPKIDPSTSGAATPDAPWAFLRGDHLELAHATLARLETGPLTHDEGDFWRYQPDLGVWERLDGERVAYATASFGGCPVGEDGKALCISDSTVRGAATLARVLLHNHPSRPHFAAKRAGVGFRNGFAVLEDGKVTLLAHAPEHMCRHAFPFDYAPEQPTPRLAEFFSELFADVSESEAADRERLLQEFVGVCLTGTATRYQRLLLITGAGCNGKSEFLRLVRGLFPAGAVASVPPQEWGERFRAARLVGVLANFVDEIPEREITTGDVFKSVITGDPISTERKNRDPFEFRPVAGHIFSANTLPGTVDQSDGYWRRFALCPFTRDFTKVASRKSDAAKEVLDHELAGLAVWALHGAARVQRASGFSTSEVAASMLAEWRDEADPVRRFVVERKWPPAVGTATSAVGAARLYEEWRVWARANGFADMSSTKFGRRVMATGIFRRTHRADGRFYERVAPSG